jgi:hypothetical protein
MLYGLHVAGRPFRNAEFSRYFAENSPCCVARRPEPYDVRPLGGTRVRTRGVLVRRLGWCGETAAASLPICGACCACYDPCSGEWLPELSRNGTSGSGDSNVTDEGMRAAHNPPTSKLEVNHAGLSREA